LEKKSVIQAFWFKYALAWNALNDYLEDQDKKAIRVLLKMLRWRL